MHAKKARKILAELPLPAAALLSTSPIILELMPSDLWVEWFHVIRDLGTLGLAMLAVITCPYSRLELKALCTALMLWRAFVLLVNVVHADPVYSPVFLVAVAAAFLGMLWRCRDTKPITGGVPRADEAYYVLMPVRTFWGVLQLLFCPWHPGRYESRAVVDNGYVCCVHKGRFRMLRESVTDAHMVGVIVPLGRQLTDDERAKLSALMGKRAITGYRDCRKMLVAGSPTVRKR